MRVTLAIVVSWLLIIAALCIVCFTIVFWWQHPSLGVMVILTKFWQYYIAAIVLWALAIIVRRG